MKAIAVIFTFLFTNLIAQVPAIDWINMYGGTDLDLGADMLSTPDGGYLMVGYSYSIDGDVSGHHGNQDYWVLKTDADGTVEWQKAFGGSNIDRAQSCALTSDGGYIVTGFSNSSDGMITDANGLHDFWTVKLTSDGTVQWQKSYGGSNHDIPQCVQQTIDGGYIIVGSTESTDGDIAMNKGYSDCWVIKLNENGDLEWENTFGGSFNDRAFYIVQTTNGEFVMLAETSSLDGDVSFKKGFYDYWLVKLDQNGELIWEKTVGGDGQDLEPLKLIETSDNGFFMVGSSQSDDQYVSGNHGDYDFWAVKTDSDGVVEWEQSYGGSHLDFAKDAISTEDGGYILIGNTYSDDGDVTGYHQANWDTFSDCWIMKISATGTVEWQKALGSHFDDEGVAIVQREDVGYTAFASGTHVNDPSWGDFHSGYGQYDFVLIRFEGNGLSLNESNKQGINVFPNPASAELNIVAESNMDKIVIMDLNGRILIEVVPSSNDHLLDIDSLGAGTYVVQIHFEDGISTTKIFKQ